MTTEYQPTREEEAYERLLEEKGEKLSKPARTVLDEANLVAYKEYMVRTYCLQPQEYEEAMEKMRRAAIEFTSQDRELLAEVVHAAKAASASIDPNDRTPVGFRVDRGDLHRYYDMVAIMVEEILQGETIRQILEALWDRFVLAIKRLRNACSSSVRWRSNWRKRGREKGQT